MQIGPVQRLPRRTVIVLAVYLIAGGGLSFSGWILDIPVLSDWDANGTAIQPNSAIAAVLIGLALIFALFLRPLLSFAAGSAAGLIGLATVFQFVTGIDLRIDTLFLFGREWGGAGFSSPGRMGPGAAVSWTLIGAAIISHSISRLGDFNSTRGHLGSVSMTLAGAAFGISILSITGYLYGAPELYSLPGLSTIALQAATFILAASVSTFLLFPDRGPASILISDSPAGALVRRALPILILLPVALGLLRLQGERLGLYDLPLGMALRALTEVLILLALLWWTAKAVSRESERADSHKNVLQKVSDSMPQVVWIAGSGGDVRYYNRRVTSFADFGETSNGIYDWRPAIHPDDLQPTNSSWTTAAESQQEFSQEHRIKMADGTYRWHLSRAIPLVEPESGETRWYGTATDIDDLKRAAEGLRASEEQFAEFMENLPGLAWIKDSEGRYLFVNNSAVTAFGLPKDEIYSKTDSEIFQPETAASFIKNDRAALADGGIQAVEILTGPDGVDIVSLVNKFPIHQNGSPPLIGGVAIDITDRKRAQDDQEFLFRISEMIRIETGPGELLLKVSEALGRHLGLHRCLFNEIDLDRDVETVHPHYSRSGDLVAGEHRISAYSSTTLKLMSDGRTVVNRDSKNDERTATHFDSIYGPANELSYIAVPMLRDGKWVASLWCSDDRPRNWPDSDVSLAEGVAERVWSAVERARATNALRLSEEKFRSLFESIDEGFVIVEVIFDDRDRPVDYRFLEANPSFTKLTGLPEDALGKTARELVPDLEEFWFETYGGVAKTGEAVRFENFSEPMNRWFDVYASRVGGDESRRVAIVFNNVTERRKIENTLRESEERFSKAFKASPLVLTISSLKTGKLVEVNDTFVEVTGFSREDAIGKTTLDLGLWLRPSDRSSEMNSVRERGQVRGEEYVFRLRDGTEIVGLLAAERIDIGGEPCALTVIQDITERKGAEAALRESEARFRNISDAAPVLIWMLDTSKNGVWFNQLWLEFTGRTMDEEAGSGWAEGVHPDDLQRFLHIFNSSFDKRLPFSIEYRFRRADGEFRWLLNNAIPRFSGTGEFVGYIGSCIDIHDRRAAESALRQSEARLQLASRIGNYGTWDFDHREARMIWSDKLFEIFGLASTPDRTMTAERFKSMIHPDDVDQIFEPDTEDRRSSDDQSAEFKIKRGDTGQTRWLRSASRYFFDKSGSVTRWVGIAQDITERKLAEVALRESEERSKLAQQAGHVGIWDWNAATDETIWSDQMWAFYGIKPREEGPSHLFWYEHLHSYDRSRIVEGVRSILGSGLLEYKDEFRIVREDGEIRWLEVAAVIDRDENGVATRMYGVNLDITESKKTAERIQASESQLRLITDTMPALISYVDRNEVYRFVNKQYGEWFGAAKTEIVGRTVRDLVGDEAYAIAKEHINDVFSGKRLTFAAWLNYRSVGQKFVHVSYVPDFDRDGAVIGFYALVSDLTEQKRSEDLFRSSEERMRILTESFTDYAIISLGPDGQIVSWNPGAENIFGYSESEIIGTSTSVLFTPEDLAKGVPDQEMNSARLTGRASDERWHVRKDGSRFFASGVMAPLFVDGALTGFAKIAADLTEKKRNSEALQRAYDEMEMRVLDRTRELSETNAALVEAVNVRNTAERQKITLLQRLVSSQEDERRRIARDLHDHLGQRLTALRLKLASLSDACKGDEELHSRVTRLQQIAELIDTDVSFLAWELRPSVLDELGLVDAIETFINEWRKHYEIRVGFHATGFGETRLDLEMETHLYRITQEALNNVVKHSEATNVSVLLERSGDKVVLIIEDDGKGFDAERVLRSDRPGGRGLGLAGIRERAELIGGSLEIESEPGNGTTVYVRVAIADLKLLRT